MIWRYKKKEGFFMLLYDAGLFNIPVRHYRTAYPLCLLRTLRSIFVVSDCCLLIAGG